MSRYTLIRLKEAVEYFKKEGIAYTQKDLAEKAGISRFTVTRYKREGLIELPSKSSRIKSQLMELINKGLPVYEIRGLLDITPISLYLNACRAGIDLTKGRIIPREKRNGVIDGLDSTLERQIAKYAFRGESPNEIGRKLDKTRTLMTLYVEGMGIYPTWASIRKKKAKQ